MGPRGYCSSLFYVHGTPRVLSLTVPCPWAPKGLVLHCSMSMGTRGSCPSLFLVLGPRGSCPSLFLVLGHPRVLSLTVLCPWAPEGLVPHCSLSLGTRGSCPSLILVFGHPRVLVLTVPCPWATGGGGGRCHVPYCFMSMGPEGLVPHCSLSLGTRGSYSSLFLVHGPPGILFLTVPCRERDVAPW